MFATSPEWRTTGSMAHLGRQLRQAITVSADARALGDHANHGRNHRGQRDHRPRRSAGLASRSYEVAGRSLTGAFSLVREPPVGIEPTTFALRGRRESAQHAPPAPTARPTALRPPKHLGEHVSSPTAFPPRRGGLNPCHRCRCRPGRRRPHGSGRGRADDHQRVRRRARRPLDRRPAPVLLWPRHRRVLTDKGGPDATALLLTDGRLTLADLSLDAPDTVQLAGTPLVVLNACEPADLSP
jgi:hypothetical protein